MASYILLHQASLRIICFGFVLLVMAGLELLRPRRAVTIFKNYRWRNNLGLVFLNTILIKLIFPLTASGVALWAESIHLGLFNYLGFTAWWVILLAIIILDLVIYCQHVLFHVCPFLWCLHQVHHADLGFDVTTGVRFHPLEIIVSLLIKFAVIMLFGIPPVAVVIFEITLNAAAMFNHSNVNLAPKFDRLLRKVLVTPDMHRVHHSILPEESRHNFGFNLACWDRLFGTYQAEPKYGHLAMEIGLEDIRQPQLTQSLFSMLRLPFVRHKQQKSV